MTHLARIPRAQERTDLPAGWSPALAQWFDDEADKAWRMTSAERAREMDGQLEPRVREIARRALQEAHDDRPRANVATVALFLAALFWGLCFGAVIFADRLFGEPTYRMEIEQ